ncbi:MAG TPA: hypothetical protein VHV77_12295 [Pirellulales bacterium]|jgi:hypothetical protein|nr:hypothetical protein [Pirellulales bacterium]
MSETLKRDQAVALSKLRPDEALAKARSISDPWYRAQALAWVARFSPRDAVKLAAEASQAARECDDVYKQVAVRAWEVAALAESGHLAEAKKSLDGAIRDSTRVTPVASKAEAMFLLLQAASRIGASERDFVHERLKCECPADSHWRCKRALKNAQLICSGGQLPRQFFW